MAVLVKDADIYLETATLECEPLEHMRIETQARRSWAGRKGGWG
jgi:hypothetical protein